MLRFILTTLLMIQILNCLPTSWASIRGPKTNINTSIGLQRNFNPQHLFEEFDSKYYYIPKNEKVSWFSALHKCHSIGGHLISLTDKVTLIKMNETYKNRKYPNYWVDLNDLHKEGEYVSMTNGLKPRFLAWCDDQEPNNINRSENCVNIENANKSKPCMKSMSCNDFQSYICESNIPRMISIDVW